MQENSEMYSTIILERDGDRGHRCLDINTSIEYRFQFDESEGWCLTILNKQRTSVFCMSVDYSIYFRRNVDFYDRKNAR